MAHVQAASFQRLVASLKAQSGEWRLEGVSPQGEAVSLSVLHGVGQSTVRLDAGSRGISDINTASDVRLAAFADSLRQGLRPSWQVATDAARQLPRGVDNWDLWRWLQGIDISPTILVIPGISALRSKIPAIDLGPISLPECVASLSLRSIAIDLHRGAVAGTLTINEARFDGDAAIAVGQGMRAVINDARLVLTLDFTYSYADRVGSVWLQSLVGVCTSGRIDPATAKVKQAVAIASGPIRLSATNVWYSFDQEESRAESGEIRLDCSSVTASVRELVIGQQVSIVGPRLTVDQATIHSRLRGLDVATGLAVEARFVGVSASFEELKLAPNADFAVLGIAAGPGGAMRAESIVVDVSSGTICEMSCGVSVIYDSATYKKAGVNIEVQPSAKNLLVLSGARDALTEQFGFRAKVESANIFSEESTKVPLKNISLSHHRIEHQPGLPLTHRTKTTTAISDIAFLITGFGVKPLDAGRMPVGWDILPSVLGALGKLADETLDDALDWLGKAVGTPLDFLGGALNLIFLGQVRVEEIVPFVNTLPVRIQFEPAWSSDQTLAFKVVGGIDGVGVRLAYSYPCPTLTDWGRRCNESEQPWTSTPKIELELGIAVMLDVDPVSKRIRVAKMTPFIPADVDESLKPLFRQLQEAALSIVAAIYGGGWIQGAVADVINAALPVKLPDQWDVSRMTVTRDAIDVGGEKVWAVELGLRFEEHYFA